ncbi:Phage terminase, small subunit [Actinobacillus pleuropneumoniae]|nr:Phage terminase, small subunit [Actinobacillus pleuropneumoniae]
MPKTKQSLEKEIQEEMTALGIYKPEYKKLINIFAGMLFQYQEFERQFEESGFQLTEEYTNKAGATNDRKVPLYTAMESLRKDIATYSDRLCLNPKSLETVTTEAKNKSTLISVIGELGNR